jgi:ribosomal protein S18 acetylase RimI-like enzyme
MRDQAAVNDLETLLVGFAADRRAIFDVVMASADHDLIVAEVDGAVVGLAHLLTYHDLSHGAPAGELLGLVVREAYRSHGIGRVLLEEVCRLARERHVGELHVNTELDNTRAQQLYRSIGAEVVGVQLEVNLQ